MAISPVLPYLLAFLVMSVAACGDAPPSIDDAGADSAADTSVDAGSDAASETAEDPLDDGGGFVEVPGTQILMDFTRAGGFYAAPFPDESRRGDDGRIDLSDFPNPRHNGFIGDLLAIIARDTPGFACTSTLYFAATGPLATEALPGPLESVAEASPLLLLDVDRDSPDYLRRLPFTAHLEAEAEPFGTDHLLALLPLQGIPLRPDTLHAAVVLRRLGDAGGEPLGVSRQMADLASGRVPQGLSVQAHQAYAAALEALDEAGIARAELAGLAVFRTGHPTQALEAAAAQLADTDAPVPDPDFARTEVFDAYCVYESTVAMPVFQEGSPPFMDGGGGWVQDESGRLVSQGTEEARIVVTVPRTPVPETGFPAVVFIRAGGGGERPLVDRGRHAVAGGPAATPGSGPAANFAAAGYAGVSVDGPHGGVRNITGGDEQVLMFNFTNPLALRDNVRQSALELTVVPSILEDLEIDLSECPGIGAVAPGTPLIDTGALVLMGHSTGATIAPLPLAVDPRYRAVILSGAGGSWIENVMHKRSPVEVQPMAELILSYPRGGLDAFDPALMLLQWAGESADPPVYARRVVSEPRAGEAPRHVLMLQGIVDTYILPPIANATSLSLGLDLGGASLDAAEPALAEFASLEDLLPLSGGRILDLPVEENRSGPGGEAVTAIVVQHLGDGMEDGHEAVFQTEGPKHQYRCFLESLRTGVPLVPVAGGEWDPCDE